MSETIAEPNKKQARSLNRWGMGTLSVLQVVFAALILIGLNYLSQGHYARVDLSRSADYTLSSATRRYLESEALSRREKPVKWVMAFRRTSPFYERVRALTEEYVRHSNGKIQLRLVDPMRNADRMQEVAAAYGLSLVRDMIIIDARADESAVITEDAQKGRVLNTHVKLVVAEDMGVFATAEGTRKLTGFQGEDLLTARLVESLEGQPRKMALLADKSRLEGESTAAPLKALESTLRFQNIELQAMNLSGMADIPDDVAGIVLAAPKYDFTDDELAVLERYWNKARSAILVLIEDGEAPPKLRTFLRAHGITPRKDRVIAREKTKLVTAARGVFTKGVEFTHDLAGQTTEFGGASSSLEVREGAEDLLNRRIYPMGLIQALDGFWGEAKFGLGKEAFDEKEDTKPPIFLAACVTRGAASDDRFAADTSRMVVMSNTDFLDPKYQRGENLDFLASSANWLVGRASLAGIGPRSLGTYKLPLLDAQVSFINRVNLFFLPALLGVIGAFVWSSRRV